MDYLISHYDVVLECILEHVELTVLTLLISFIIAFPIGVLISKCKIMSGPINGIFNTIYAIPSIALFGFLIPYTGIGTGTAITAFVVYNQYMLIKSVEAGFDSISPTIHEIGKGLGYNKVYFFFSVELPLALPSIVNGLKLATIGTVTGSTLGATIGAGGLGVLIFRGLKMRHWNKVIIGTVLCTILAFASSLLLQAIENRVRKRAQGEL